MNNSWNSKRCETRTFCSDLLGAIAATSEYGHRFVTSNLSGLYVAMPVLPEAKKKIVIINVFLYDFIVIMSVLPIARIRLYFPFHECFVTK